MKRLTGIDCKGWQEMADRYMSREWLLKELHDILDGNDVRAEVDLYPAQMKLRFEKEEAT